MNSLTLNPKHFCQYFTFVQPVKRPAKSNECCLVTFYQSGRNSVTQWLKPTAGALGAVVLPITAAGGRYWATIRHLCSLNLTFIQGWAVDTERAPKWQDVQVNLSDGEVQWGKHFLFGPNQCFYTLNPTNHLLFTLPLNILQHIKHYNDFCWTCGFPFLPNSHF